jgi:RNA polymerase sigma-70 factor (ECF subfamily)
MMQLLDIFRSRTRQQRFEALVQPHLESLYKQAYRYTGNGADAEDLIQDVLLESFEKRDKLKGVNNVGSWLNRCLYHRFVDRYRTAKRMPEQLDVHSRELQAQLVGASLDESKVFAQQLVEGLELLSLEQKSAIKLHDLCGHSLAEVSEIMQMPVGTLKSHLHRGRKQLQKQLQLKPEMQASGLRSRG